jgi:hypothetical protein
MTMRALSAVATPMRGYRAAPPSQRAGFWVSAAFAATVGVSRAVNYGRERSRAAPRLRSWGRHLYHSPGADDLRIHHHLPGIATVVIAGGVAILTRTGGSEAVFGIPFGVGAGLTLDEVAVLAESDNPYWESELLSIIQAGVAATAAAALGLGFYRRGAALPDPNLGHEGRRTGSDRDSIGHTQVRASVPADEAESVNEMRRP